VARFVRYALRFERAFKTDEWQPVAACFDDDAVYRMIGAPPFESEIRGANAIVKHFQENLDDFDRRFDRRSPKITSLPRITRNTLDFDWRARYVLGADSFVLIGRTHCVFRGKCIHALTDTMDPDTCRQGADFATRFRTNK
jgi:hypothetical protein